MLFEQRSMKIWYQLIEVIFRQEGENNMLQLSRNYGTVAKKAILSTKGSDDLRVVSEANIYWHTHAKKLYE